MRLRDLLDRFSTTSPHLDLLREGKFGFPVRRLIPSGALPVRDILTQKIAAGTLRKRIENPWMQPVSHVIGAN